MTPQDRQEWVFGGKIKGKCIVPIWTFWKRVCIEAGLEGVRVHDLRHTFASQAALMGHSLIEIKKMLGHKRLEMTMQYVHIADPETYKAATLMAETLTDMLENNDILE